jgi:hypothetical protein
VRDLILFQQSEPAGIKIATETWALPSTNLNNPKDFQAKIGSLPKYHFLHYNTQTHLFQTCQVPFPLPNFRIALHPSDLKVTNKLILFGNDQNFDLTSIERTEEEIADVEEDNEPLYRKPPPEAIEESQAPEGDPEDPVNLLGTDLIEPEDEPKPVKKRKAQEETAKSKKPKKDATQTLLEAIDESEQKSGNIENLSKEDMVIRHRILHILKYIQAGAPGNPDQVLLNDRNLSFLQRNFDKMSFQELKDAYREYANHKSMNGMICGIENRFNGLEGIVHQAARHLLGWEGDPSIFTGHLKGMRHESVLGAIARSNPYKQEKISSLDQLANVILPMATAGYAVYNFKNKKQEHEKSLESAIPQTETEDYLNNIVVPTTEQ